MARLKISKALMNLFFIITWKECCFELAKCNMV
jgi:hypothetical protein